MAEQFRSDYLTQFAGLFGPGGFRKLMDEGAFFPDCRMEASTFSAPGIVTIATGAYPQAHGIVAESWYDRGSKEVVAASAEWNRASTLADQIAAADDRNRVYVTAVDAVRAALLVDSVPFPHSRHTIIPLEGPLPPDDPDWAESYRQSHAPERFKGAKWQALQAAPNAPALRTLVDEPARPGEFRALYNASPFAQENQFEFLRTMIIEEGLGMGPGLDFAGVVLTPMALLGYEVGADSPLMREMVLHLDRQIELTLEALRKAVGAGNFGLAFTAAHGLAPAETVAVDGSKLAAAMNEALRAAFGAPGLVERYVYPFVYLNRSELRRNGIDAAAARVVAGEAGMHGLGVAAYYTADGRCSRSGEWLRRFQNSFNALHSGDLMLAYEANMVERFGDGRGVSYGSLYNYDVQTPLLLYGPQFHTVTEERPVEAADIAPTLARALRVAAPNSSSGRVLGGAFAPDAKVAK